jgi:hypothetical protein
MENAPIPAAVSVRSGRRHARGSGAGGPVPGRLRRILLRRFDRWRRGEDLFWPFNLGYWFLYWLFLAVTHATAPGCGWVPKVILWTSLIACIGATAGLWLHLAYRRIRLETVRPVTLFLWVVAAVFAGGNYWYGVDVLLDQIMKSAGDNIVPYTWSNYLTYTFYYEILLGGWSVLYLVTRFWAVLAQQRERSQVAESLARHSRIQMLRYQLNPHFLFNALNSARALIDEDERNARDMMTELSEFLRYSLVTKDETDIPLRDEVDALRHYFAVEKKRYEDKLQVTFDIGPGAEDYPVIPFLLHPLVENAVKYGMKTSRMPLTIRIAGRVDNGRLAIDVSNTGTWIAPQAEGHPAGTGTGLSNVRKRLETLFPGRHRFSFESEEGSVHVRIELANPAAAADRKEARR